jgi:pimeloyl-ACP methyl ester carboxylesterase
VTARVDELDIETRHEWPFLVTPEHGEPLSLVVFLHWFDESPNSNRTQFLDEAKGLAEHGIASVLPQLSFPWKEEPSALGNDLRLLVEERTELERVVSTALERTGAGKLAIVGHDFGAMHGMLLARELDPACGVFIAATPRWSDWFLPFWSIEGDRYEYMRGLHDVDPINVVERIDAPLLFQFGRQDFFIAAMTGSELANAAREPKKLIAYEAEHDMDVPDARLDRESFLLEHLRLDQ